MRKDPKEVRFGANIPKGTWHSLEVKEENTVVFEAKDGPWQPLGEEDVMW